MEEAKRQHLEFIQNIISRMNSNCAQAKTVNVTIVSALLAIYASTNNIIFIFLGIAPTLLLGFIDSYYLLQERKFRGIYEDVAGLKNRVRVKLYEMPIEKYTGKLHKKFSYWNVFLSKTISGFYLPIIVFLIVLSCILKNNCLNI
jgi:UDP-N-acetylmuramyl pentapeptide phosphotransferase/UDP-N-acetylglucosamine-1-phosphate transferase